MPNIEIWVLDFIVEAAALFFERRLVKSADGLMTEYEVWVEGVLSLNIGVLDLFASKLFDGVEVSGMIESFIADDEVVVEN